MLHPLPYRTATIFVAGILSCLSAVSSSQEFPVEGQVWQLLRSPANFATVTAVFSGSPIPGYKFTVTKRGDGALPLVRAACLALNPNWIAIYRKIDAGTYAYYCAWAQNEIRASAKGGVLLQPGEYLVYNNVPNSIIGPNTPMLSGSWVSTEYQSDYWMMAPGPNSVSNEVDIADNAIEGVKFTVTTRGDGAVPVITDMVGRISEGFALYKRQPGGKYALYTTASPTPGVAAPQVTLAPGTYLALATNLTSQEIRHLNIFSGYWLKPIS